MVAVVHFIWVIGFVIKYVCFYRLLYYLLLYVITGIQRRTIYEYHRVEVDFGRIQSNTIVILDPLISMSQKK